MAALRTGLPARLGGLALGALGAAGLPCAACSPGRGPAPPRPPPAPPGAPNLVLVSIDSLRADALGCAGGPPEASPFLDGLAASGTRFARAVSTTSWTLPAHAALFTGLPDATHGLVDNGARLAEGHLTLAEHLRARGYHTAGFYGGPYLHPCFGLAQGFERWTSCMGSEPEGEDAARREASSERSSSHADVTGPRTRERVARWAADEAREPFFLFVHLWDVHYDYLPPPEYAARFDPGYAGPVDGRDVMGPAVTAASPDADRRHLRALYDAEVRFTDDVLRGIWGDLEARGLLANTVVVVTADHGEEFFEHGGKGHQRTLYEEVVRVPLIACGPGIAAGLVRDELVRLIDVFPTLAALVGGDATPPAVQGRDLGPLLRGEPGRGADALLDLSVNAARVHGLRTTDDLKLLVDAASGASELYDLARDPAERRPLPAGSIAWGRTNEALSAALANAARVRALLDLRAPEAAAAPPEVLERLRELGYLGGGK